MTDTETLKGRDRLEGLLPFYLNGTLEGEELDAVESWLADDPAAMAALAEAEAEYSGAAMANERIAPPPGALARFSKALEAEAGPERKPADASWLASLWQSIAGIPKTAAWATAAIAVAILAAQLYRDTVREPGRIEIAGTEDPAAAGPFVFVVFRADAPMSAVQAELDAVDATIIAGPLAGGMFRVGVPAKDAADYDRLVAALAASPSVEAVTAGRRPGNGN